jgi:hypothetical protein
MTVAFSVNTSTYRYLLAKNDKFCDKYVPDYLRLALCPVLFLCGVLLGSLPLVLVAGSGGGCVH